MSGTSRMVNHFATTLFIKGTLLFTCGAVALGWAEATLGQAMVFAALFLAMAGLNEMVLAWQSRKDVRGWLVGFLDGGASIAFALLTVTVTVVSTRTTLLLTALWLALYGTFTGALALAVWPMAKTRIALLAWTAASVVVAVMAAAYAETDIFTLLYAGAAFAIVYGLFQLGAGRWMRRVAVPLFGPTVQSSWITIRP